MRKKALIVASNILCCSFIVHTMEDPPLQKNVNKSQTVIQITDDPVARKQKKPSPVPPVVIASQISSSSRTLTKKRVESVKKLGEHIAGTQKTQRTAREQSRREKVIDNDDDDMPPVSVADDSLLTRKKRSFLPRSVDTLAGKKLEQPKTMYTKKEVWALIQSCNPTLHDFGKKYGLELDDLEVFAACIEEFEINPKLITEHIHAGNQQIEKGIMRRFIDRICGDPYDSHLDRLHKRYEEMQQKDPEGYKAMLLELMKAAADQEESKQTNRSKIIDTHTSLQNQEIANQVMQTRTAVAGLVVAIATAIPGWLTSILQFSNPANCTS